MEKILINKETQKEVPIHKLNLEIESKLTKNYDKQLDNIINLIKEKIIIFAK